MANIGVDLLMQYLFLATNNYDVIVANSYTTVLSTGDTITQIYIADHVVYDSRPGTHAQSPLELWSFSGCV